MLYNYWWVPVLIIINLIAAKLSCINQSGNNTIMIWLCILGAIPLWAIVSKYSKDILFSAVLYDCIVIVDYTIGIAYFGNKILTTWNCIGILLMFVGVALVKL